MHSTTVRLILAMLLVLLSGFLAVAQQPTGTISGRVTDEKGAVVPGAKVTITEKTTARVIDVVANGEGFFEARSLPPGSYNVKVEQQGFASSMTENVIVQT